MGVQLLDKTRKSTNYCITTVRAKSYLTISVKSLQRFWIRTYW